MAANWMRRTFVAAACASAALLTACGSSSVDSAISPDRFVIFGDGLADQGQLGTSFTVNDGAINNWAAQFASRYDVTTTPSSKGGTNYAYGNARISATPDAAGNASTPTVVQQIDTFLAGNKIGDNDMVVVSAGVSDVIVNITAFMNGSITEDQLLANATQAGADLAAQVKRLNAAGAKHIVVTGTFDLSRTPWAKIIDQEQRLSKVMLALNNKLKIDINELGGKQVLYIDAAYQVNLFQGSPGSYGFTNSEKAVCNSVDAGAGNGTGTGQINSALCNTSTVIDENYNRYVFSDNVYLTPEANRRLGDYARDIVVLQW
ncbi:SGNH/GDSL hydrolase family protein [Diaphorobacter caeni]|uniref:SGNH/GDSL hydrolase family protein n=1 Tax=Diaphorobacter caeni TaxID=2784387 RepID=UPI00189031F1|nr:SGNH/GDSL hydrolase family protein [Diaphorobacter caeni]MBF5007791.1 SGNH/GDSL hydrolase family protein [Diaphorobacter caeni]